MMWHFIFEIIQIQKCSRIIILIIIVVYIYRSNFLLSIFEYSLEYIFHPRLKRWGILRNKTKILHIG